VVVLLVRTDAAWGKLPAPGAAAPTIITLCVDDDAGLSLPAEECVLREWTCVLPRGLAFDEHETRSVASAACRWVSEQASADPDCRYLLGMAAPPQVATGIGLIALDDEEWPEQLHPLQYSVHGKRFVVPEPGPGAVVAAPGVEALRWVVRRGHRCDSGCGSLPGRGSPRSPAVRRSEVRIMPGGFGGEPVDAIWVEGPAQGPHAGPGWRVHPGSRLSARCPG